MTMGTTFSDFWAWGLLVELIDIEPVELLGASELVEGNAVVNWLGACQLVKVDAADALIDFDGTGS